jgi:hypothetical protein
LHNRTKRIFMKKLFLSVVMVYSGIILYSQKVGVNKVNPQERLHVGGSLRVEDNLIAYQNGTVYDSLVVGTVAGAAQARVRVAGGKTQTETLTAGGEGFPNKMFSVYGNAQFLYNLNTGSMNVTGDGVVNGNYRVNGRIGINGLTNANYGLIVNNANSYFQGDAIIGGNNRVNGRIGINGATNASYGLIVNNANSYLQGSVHVVNDAVITGNSRIDGRIGINGSTNVNYGLMVNNAHSYFQGNLTVTGDLDVLGNSNITGEGNVTSNGSSSIRIGYIQYHINKILGGNDDGYETFDLPEFGTNIDDIRVSVYQYVDGYNDPWISTPQEFRWWISDINPDNNTARIRVRNLAPGERRLIGELYILIMIRD